MPGSALLIAYAIVIATPNLPRIPVAPGAAQPRAGLVEISATISGAYPPATLMTCCDLRTPPRHVGSGNRYKLTFFGGEARVYWGRRVSFVGSISRSFASRYEVTLTRPPSPPPALPPGSPSYYVTGRATLRREWAVSVAHGVDFLSSRRLHPWCDIGVSFEQVVERFQQSSALWAAPASTGTYSVEFKEPVVAITAALGLRYEAANRMFLTIAGIARFPISDDRVDVSRAAWRAGVGVRF